ncbi:MAG: fused MFS/spermidine synthase [Verrucomicrobia bacterium]|nr:fused MFS/spermidine synthase [Verrucomicrobiota bacterium]
MLLYSPTIFLSAFLLFLLQLIIAKQILPWFGGSAAVWTTCLVFFQSVLLLGYAYSDGITRWFSLRRQSIIHAVLLVLSLALLPIIPDASWKPTGAENPALRILLLLTATIGLPFFLLSTTSPLLQSWFARACPDKSPYRLFALSNLASMIALLGYPLVIERWIGAITQARFWSLGYAAFAILCCATAWRGMRSTAVNPTMQLPDQSHEPPPTFFTQLLWAALAALGSVLLLAVTNHLTQDVASIPLLWVLPLSIYLLTFILCFDGRGWYQRDIIMSLVGVMLVIMSWCLAQYQFDLGFILQISIFSDGLFVSCMFCHGELNRLRPAPRHLTRFYLMISLGGAIGALLVGIIAPNIFSGVYELPVALASLAALWIYQMRGARRLYLVAGVCLLLITVSASIFKIVMFSSKAKLITRNFYGVVRVLENDPGDADHFQRTLTDGTTVHGEQFPNGRYSRVPSTYYTANSGIGRTLNALGQKNARVGIIGLGAGTIATYGKRGDVYRFYEINPSVIEIAQRDFSYLKDSAAKIEIVLGDARLNLEREPSQQFIVLAVDAFSSDAIPVHLMTREAISLYLKHLAPEGVLAFHITNKSLDLAPVLQRLADAHDLKTACIIEDRKDNKQYPSEWVLLTRSINFLEVDKIRNAASAIQSRPDSRVWTDDFNNVIQALK